MKVTRSLLGKSILFAALGLLDLLLTWYLLQGSPGRVYEANPVARWCLECFGLVGLAAFKVIVTALVVTAITLLARRHPTAAGRVLSLACLATAAVVGYSALLLGHVRGQAGPDRQRDEATLAVEAGQLQTQFVQLREYRSQLKSVSTQLLEGRCSLDDAVARLGETARVKDPRFMAMLQRQLPNCSPREYLEANILDHARSLAERRRRAGGKGATGPGLRGLEDSLSAAVDGPHVPLN
jgi:hypothetical protein